MSEQKRLDRSELREKAEQISIKVWDMALASVRPDAKPEDYQVIRTNTLKWARGAILALIPDIEEAKKQERERIKEWGDEVCVEHSKDRWYRRECPKCWQALKEEK